MKKIALTILLTCILLPFSNTANAVGTKIEGCVYDKKTKAKIAGKFVIRLFYREGFASAGDYTGGCYSGITVSGPFGTGNQLDFIEVVYKLNGRFYTDQHKLNASASPVGFNLLGVPANTSRHDFFLDITQ